MTPAGLRARRTAAALGAAAVVLACGALPAHAAGTGGIDLSPLPAEPGGRTAATFRVEVPRSGEVQVRYRLRNVEDGPRSATVYTARVTTSDGSYVLGEPDSSPYVRRPRQQVTLQAGESVEQSFTVSAGPDGPPEGEQLAAVVLEVRNGSVVQRANTLVVLTAERQVPLPLLLVVLAVVLLLAGGFGVAALARRRTPPAADRPAS